MTNCCFLLPFSVRHLTASEASWFGGLGINKYHVFPGSKPTASEDVPIVEPELPVPRLLDT